jgi:acid phosphatase (class A)
MNRIGLSLAFAILATAAGAAIGQTPATPTPSPSAPAPAMRPAFLGGYLPKGSAPSSLTFLPPSPAKGSATQARDSAMAKIARALKGSPRWRQASLDADLKFPGAANTYSCALGVDINPTATPRLYALLSRTLIDAGLATYPAKNKYQRPRPFMVAGGDICTPAADAGLRKDGAYPSGHASAGWAWALILAEAAPERQDAILARGRAFMQSRVICNVHWLSDVEAGGLVGTAVVARLHDDPVFRADLEAGRSEIAAARAAGLTPTRDCKAEAAALSLDPMPAP